MKRTVVMACCIALAACASARGEMDKYLDEQVGKPLDDPQGFRAQQAQKRIHTRHLANGRSEEEYLVGFRDGCRVFLEVDEQQRKVLDWRYGQTVTGDSDCYMNANVGK